MTDALSARPVGLPSVRLGRVGRGAVLVVASFGAFLAFLDSTIVNVAFPKIAASFPHAGLGELSWVLNAYNIVFAAFLIAAGRLADLLGRRRAFRLGVLIFTLASVACAAAGSVPMLVALRGVQAFGAALLVPASLALVVEAYPAEHRSHAVGLWGASAALAAGLGPPIGGALVDIGGWRLAFLVNLPLGIAAWVAGRRLLVESRAPGRRTMPDLAGAGAIAGALGVFTLGLVEGDTWGWTSPGVIACFASAALLTGLFLMSSKRHPSPVLDPALLRIPTFRTANLLTVAAGAGFYAYLLTHILWLTFVWHWSVLEAGLALAPGAFVAAAVAAVAGSLADRYGARMLVLPGAVIWTAAYLWYAVRVGTTPDFLGEWLPGQVLSGIGVGCTLPVLGSAALEAVPGGRYATASAVVSSARQLGGVFGISILVAIIGRPSGIAGVSVLRHGWLFSAGCFALVAVGSRWLVPPVRVAADEDDAVEAIPETPRPVIVAQRRPSEATDAVAPAPTVTALLGAVPMLAALGPATVEVLARSARSVTVTAGDWLFREGDAADAVYVVRSGAVDVVRGDETVRTVTRGAVIGELGLLTRAPRAAGIRARRDSDLVRLSRRRFDAVVASDAGAMRLLASTLAGQVQRSRTDAQRAARPRTVAIVAVDALVPIGFVGELIERCVATGARVARLVNGDAHQLEVAERANDIVLLSVGADDAAWQEFALRQADRVLLVGSVTTDPATAPRFRADHDVWLFGGEPSRPLRTAWLDAGARSCTAVPVDLGALDDVARRYADRLTRRSVGLVLSGGGARALAHIGVIEELQRHGVRVDNVAGCSFGAYVAALVAAGLSADEIEDRVYAEFVRRNPAGDYGIPRHALVRGKRGRAMLERTFGDMLIEELPMDYYTVATDLFHRELVVLRRGPIADAVGPSMALPGILPPQRRDGRVLVDGGVLDNLPVGPMVARDEGPVIAVNVVDGNRSAREGEPRMPGLQEVVMRSMTISSAAQATRAREQVALWIAPRHRGVGLLEFHQYARMRAAGREAAQVAIDDLGGIDRIFDPPVDRPTARSTQGGR